MRKRTVGKGLLLCAILALATLAGCDRKPHEVIVEKFPAEYSLRGKGIDSLNRFAGMYGISVAGDKFIGVRKSTKFFLVFDKDFHPLDEILPKGHGHNEFMSPLYCGQFEQEGNREYVYVLERGQRKLYKISLSDDKEDPECLVDIPLRMDLDPSFLFRLNDSVCIGTNCVRNNPFVVLNTKTWNLRTFEPTFSFNGNEEDLFVQSQNTGTYSAKQGRVSVAYFNLPQMDIRSADGDLLRTVVYERKLSPSEMDCENLKDYFGWVTSSDKYIYAKYDGDERKAAEGRTWIMVFDWEGAPVCRMEIDASVHFAVDEKNGRIISLNEDDTKFVASEYRLPDTLLGSKSLHQ